MVICEKTAFARLALRVAGILAVVVFLCGLCLGKDLDRGQWQQPNRVMADLSIKTGSTVADVGCGAGYFTFRLSRAVGPAGKVYAVDINAKAVAKLQAEAEKEHLSNIKTIVSDPTNTKLPSECADLVLICDVLHEAPKEQRLPLIKDAVRALKPGGFLFLIDYRKSREVPFDPYEKLIPREDLVKLCEDAGLSLDAEFSYLKYQVFLRFRKP